MDTGLIILIFGLSVYFVVGIIIFSVFGILILRLCYLSPLDSPNAWLPAALWLMLMIFLNFLILIGLWPFLSLLVGSCLIFGMYILSDDR